MARKGQVSVENNFTKGLVTQKHALQFPENACTEASNVMLDEKGRMVRRPGIDLEEGYALFSVAAEVDERYSEYVWANATGSGDKTLLVQQKGSNIYFFDITSSTTPSANRLSFSISLTDHIAAGSSLLPKDYECSFAQGGDVLLIVNPAVEPLYVKYDIDADDYEVGSIDVKYRDFEGVDDGLTLNERLTIDLSALKGANALHYYNLINQGWGQSDALAQWDAARTDVPSNADVVGLFRAAETDAFDNVRVTAKSPGNSPAPKGHFILPVFNPNRTQAMADEGYTDVYVGASAAAATLAGSVVGALFSTITDGANAIDSDAGTYATWTNGAAITLELPAAKKLLSFTLDTDDNTGTPLSTGTVTVTISSKASAAASWTTVHSSDVPASSLNSTTFVLSPQTNVAYYSIRLITTDYASFRVNGINAIEDTNASFIDPTRPSYTAFFAGRAVYAGIATQSSNNKIYFSQIIEEIDQLGRCYQANDPTNEYFSDLLPNDGGVISISDVAQVTGLFSYQTSLVVFATNGVWLVKGTSGNGFRATDYAVSKLSSIGCQSPKSIVDYKGVPVWFGEDGIYSMKYDANFDSFSVYSLSDDSIKEFFLAIEPRQRNLAKGVYDTLNSTIYWLYREVEEGESAFEYPYSFNRVLSFKPMTNAFLPLSIGRTNNNVNKPRIFGVVYIYDNNRLNRSEVRFTTRCDGNLTYSEFKESVFSDWKTYAAEEGEASNEIFYESWFITGHKIHGDAIRFVQPNYFFVFSDYVQGGRCKVQARFDFSNKSTAGLWGSTQEVYGPYSDSLNTKVRRLKIRGKGRSMQFKFSSHEDKPFALIGWAIDESQNAQV